MLDSQVGSFARAAAKTGSGVRARWIELPDCQQMVKWDSGDATYQESFGEVIPLKADLSNAIIATCKGPSVAQNTPVPVPNPAAGIPTPVEKSQIYDPVWKTNTIIPDGEHQVQQMQQGHVAFSEQTIGPRGDFYMKWKYEEDGTPNQPFQTDGAPWDHAGPGGVNYTVVALPTNYNNSLRQYNTRYPVSQAAGGVDHVTPTGINLGDDTGHWVQPQPINVDPESGNTHGTNGDNLTNFDRNTGLPAQADAGPTTEKTRSTVTSVAASGSATLQVLKNGRTMGGTGIINSVGAASTPVHGVDAAPAMSGTPAAS
jgi:hypothetical protein